jgi:serine/threonine-protein phosphatase PGAM5
MLGRKQAGYTGKRLRENIVDRIVHSTMPRAAETAAIIKKGLSYRGPFQACDELRECVPDFPKALRKKYGYTDVKKLARDKAQAERAFKKYFKPSSKDSVEILVCHGNIIRYLICRLMGVDTLTWRLMDIQQCGISVVELRSKGTDRKVLISHNDVGHIPKHERTFF